MKKAYLQFWEESERGWGTRPDGCSLHLTVDSHKSYIKNIYDSRDPNNIPDEYDRIIGDIREVNLSNKLFNEVLENGCLRLPQNSTNNLINLGEIKLEDEYVD